jgi:hypothetical protein
VNEGEWNVEGEGIKGKGRECMKDREANGRGKGRELRERRDLRGGELREWQRGCESVEGL